MGCRVQVWGLGFKVQGLGLGFKEVRFRSSKARAFGAYSARRRLLGSICGVGDDMGMLGYVPILS